MYIIIIVVVEVELNYNRSVFIQLQFMMDFQRNYIGARIMVIKLVAYLSMNNQIYVILK